MINKLQRRFSFLIHYIQLIISWCILHLLKRDLMNQDLWLIREKRDEARDNGYHFYKYLRQNYPHINAYYVITGDSVDLHKVIELGNLIKADSWDHCIYFLAARLSINSQQFGAYPFHFSARELNIVQKLCNRKQKVVFLQHGITQNKLQSLSYDLCNIDYFVTSTKKEYEFVKETYNYPDDAIGCVGLARFDNLYTPHIVEDKILVMPTWRAWLDKKTSSRSDEDNTFYNSDYYDAYAKLLKDDDVIESLRNNHYKLVFYMHYKLQPYVDMFRCFENDVITIASKADYDVQDLLMTSKFMITDYSSVFFDFAYMDKPLLYYQFDKQQFRSGHYAEGYFSYEEDGFGPCFEKFDDMKKYIMDMINDQCRQPSKYDLRVKEFFDLRDNHNCERTYNAIKELLSNEKENIK